MAYKLAIVISGAVSLGSYESGVMYEIIDAIGQHNTNTPDPDEHILIDVITGASAGGMTGTILAQKLLYEGGRLNDPYDNDLYNPWVAEIDIEGLLSNEYGDDPALSLLSSNYVREIANRYVLERYANNTVPQRSKHPAAADEIHLGLAMSNLNGVDYSKPVSGVASEVGGGLREDLKFTYTRYQDRFEAIIRADAGHDTRNFWQHLTRAARSCGAFPFAFRLMEIARDYDSEYYAREGADRFSAANGRFAYSDGGLFHNEPLGMAKMLVNRIDPEHTESERRFYLYVSPNPKASSSQQGKDRIIADDTGLFRTGTGIIHAYYNQARFRDWVRTVKKNEQVDLLDARAEGLRDLVESAPSLASFSEVGKALLDKLYEEEPAARANDFARLRHQYADDYNAVVASRDTATAAVWLENVQVLEKAARLGDIDKMNIYSIMANDDELAGEKLVAFGGFLDRRFRDYDYDQGRTKAQAFLAAIKASSGHIPLKNFTLRNDIRPMDHALRQAGMEDVERDIREQVKRRVLSRIKLAISNSDKLGWFSKFFARILSSIFFSIFLNQLLALDDSYPLDDSEED